MTIPILFEDQDIVVINKPPGIVVNRAETHDHDTIQDWLVDKLKQEGETRPQSWSSLVPAAYDDSFGTPEAIFAERQGLVHRLDKNTSGVLLLAKNPGALVALLAQFKQRQTEKQYLALVHGKFAVPEATLVMPIGRASQDRKLFAVKASGREAVTKYQVKQQYRGLNLAALDQQLPELSAETKRRFSLYQGFSLIQCWPKTGRTHQIRVHLAHIKHPIVGDITYVGRKRKGLDPLWCPRHFLHASELTITHPRSSQTMTFSAPLSADLTRVLEMLEPG